MNQNNEEPSGESWGYFLDEVDKKTGKTKRVYLRYMKEFLKGFKPRGRIENFTPDELYEYFKGHIESTDRRKIKKLETELHEYYSHLLTDGVNLQTGEANGLHIMTVQNYENAVLCFLEANYLKNRLQYRVKFNSEVKREHEDQFTNNGKDKAETNEIKRLLDYMSHPRNISAVLTLRDTGLRVSDLVNMKVKHIVPILEDTSIKWYTFEIIPIKNMRQETPLPANPCMGPESIEALRVWMQYREEFYDLPPEPESYVYCAINNYPAVDGRDEVKVGDPVLPTAFSRMMRYERRRAGIKKEISPHSLRKTHSTNLIGGGVPERWVNVMQGKKGKGTQGAYQRPNEQELIEVYQKAYHKLSLEDLVVGEKVSKLNQRLEDQQKTIEQLQRQIEYLIATGGGEKRISDDEMLVRATGPRNPEPDLMGKATMNQDEKEYFERLEKAKEKTRGKQ